MRIDAGDDRRQPRAVHVVRTPLALPLRSSRRRARSSGEGWVVVGAGGRLGSTLCRILPQAVGLRTAMLDLTCPVAVQRVLRETRARVVVNAAALTHVDQAERAPLHAKTANATIPGVLAAACTAMNALLVQVSSDYVFGGDAARCIPYTEDAPPAPVNVYGHTKLQGEKLAAAAPRHLIIRTCGLYGEPGSKPSFVDAILRLAAKQSRLSVVADQWCSPSYALHVAQAIVQLVQADATGTYHAVNPGEVSWYDLACEAVRLAQIRAEVVPIALAEYGHFAPRPRYTVLDTSRYTHLVGASLPSWREALSEYLRVSSPPRPCAARSQQHRPVSPGGT